MTQEQKDKLEELLEKFHSDDTLYNETEYRWHKSRIFNFIEKLTHRNGFKVFIYDVLGGWNGEREYLQKFATQVSLVKDFSGKDKIVLVVPRGVDEQVDAFIQQKD